MKNVICLVVLIHLSSCTVLKKNQEELVTLDKKKNSHLIDLCAYENMPSIPDSPKLYPEELRSMTEDQMDNRIRAHIRALDGHVQKLEKVIHETRRRVELCR